MSGGLTRCARRSARRCASSSPRTARSSAG
jgi:hypothetical protein